MKNILVFFLVFYVMYLYLVIIRDGIPVFNQLERSKFALNYSGTLAGLLYKYKTFIALLLGISYKINNSSKRTISLGLIVAYLIYLFLTGNKFSSIFYSTILILIPNVHLIIFLYKNYKVKDNINQIIIILLILLITIYIFFNHIFTYYSFLGSNLDILNEYLIPRFFASQSEVWWSSWNDFYTGRIDSYNQLLVEIKNFLFGGDPNQIGMSFLMLEHGHNALEYINSGRVYTGGYPAILLYMMPLILGFLLQIPLALIFGVIIRYFIKCIYKVYLFRLWLIFDLLSGFQSMYLMGDISSLLSKRKLAILILLIIIEFYFVKRYGKKDN
ncbi:DUF6418 domain-containing protein [Gracilimonas sp. Q87]|uniref:DUF6418 domain-containing protein n=1 Tax=Gracilimonas sp. Q87 TaxID=3384766 RepID=UPI00398428F9